MVDGDGGGGGGGGGGGEMLEFTLEKAKTLSVVFGGMTSIPSGLFFPSLPYACVGKMLHLSHLKLILY